MCDRRRNGAFWLSHKGSCLGRNSSPIESRANHFKFWILIVHRRSHILVSRRLDHRFYSRGLRMPKETAGVLGANKTLLVALFDKLSSRWA
jgi:hypothetical protein